MEIDFELVRPIFGGKLNQKQVDGIKVLVAAFDAYGDGDRRKLGYILATAKHETGDFRYTHEIWGPTPAQKRYEGRADLGNTVAGDGKRFMGRGFVQITGRANYTDWGRRLKRPLVDEPILAEAPEIAARICVQGMMLGTFTGKKLADYINGKGVDLTNARRTVNGTDKAETIAGYARAFLPALNETSGEVIQPAEEPPVETFEEPLAPMPQPKDNLLSKVLRGMVGPTVVRYAVTFVLGSLGSLVLSKGLLSAAQWNWLSFALDRALNDGAMVLIGGGGIAAAATAAWLGVRESMKDKVVVNGKRETITPSEKPAAERLIDRLMAEKKGN